MVNLLSEVGMSGKYVSIYMDKYDTSKFVFGKILCVNNDYIAVHMISPAGKYDGILVKQTDEVIRLEMDDRYFKKMMKICDVSETETWNINKCDIVNSVLDMAKKARKIISCELLNSGNDDVVGFVESCGERVCKVKQVDSYGDEDGYSYIRTDDITQISFDSEDEQLILKLWERSNAEK